MFKQHETPLLQWAVPVVVGILGLTCCVLALLDMRSQQAFERLPAQPAMEPVARLQEPHHMRGWQSHRLNVNGATQRAEGVMRSLS